MAPRVSKARSESIPKEVEEQLKKLEENPGLRHELAALSWKLIEWKLAYYRPEAIHPTRKKALTIDDDVYDAHERRYLTLVRFFGVSNNLVHKGYPEFPPMPYDNPMMEVDEERPSVQLAMRKLRTPNN